MGAIPNKEGSVFRRSVMNTCFLRLSTGEKFLQLFLKCV